MSISRLIIGLLFILAGIILTVVCFFSNFFFLIYSIPLMIIGFVILLNKNEDKIERRKDLKEKEYKR